MVTQRRRTLGAGRIQKKGKGLKGGKIRGKLVLLHGLAKDNASAITAEPLETMPAIVRILGGGER